MIVCFLLLSFIRTSTAGSDTGLQHDVSTIMLDRQNSIESFSSCNHKSNSQITWSLSFLHKTFDLWAATYDYNLLRSKGLFSGSYHTLGLQWTIKLQLEHFPVHEQVIVVVVTVLSLNITTNLKLGAHLYLHVYIWTKALIISSCLVCKRRSQFGEI